MMKKITTLTLQKMKEKGERIACLTAYDYIFARLLDEAGIELILVGDSAGMVYAGYENTLPVTMDEMIYHTRAVKNGVSRALLIADMPFGSFQFSPEETIKNAVRFLKEGGAEGVKIEGGEPMLPTIKRLVSIGIPVMGHLGLTPQSVHQLGGFRVQGKEDSAAERIKKEALLLEEAGVFAIVLEKVPATLAKEITSSIKIPTIGIGAGPDCDGQILVTYDMLGLFEDLKLKFVRKYAELAPTIKDGVSRYISDVKNRNFPSKEESF